ncbi:MAG TPA: hypothetical protein VFV50_10810 [Bdellovibrionales bacterium]|nr:hypothetical protein [Bdellovibrionales bacterium]
MSSLSFRKILVSSLILVVASQMISLEAKAQASTKARKLFERLTGVPLSVNDPRLNQMATLISQGKNLEAAQIATQDPAFYNDTVRQWAAPMSNKDQTAFVPLNDFIAMVIGVARDQTDARELLSGNFTYYVRNVTPSPSPDNNTHYERAETMQADLHTNLVRSSPQDPRIPEAAGVLTSRAWGDAHLKMGTNRRAIQYSMMVFLCRPIESLMDFTIPDNWVRRDVDRKPGGAFKTYQTRCVGCHAGMDALGGAYARFDFGPTRLVYGAPPYVATKMNQNKSTFPPGNVVVDDSWENLWLRNSKNQLESPGVKNGIRAYGEFLSNTELFRSCMAQTVYTEVCRRKPEASEAKVIEDLANKFQSSGYKLKTLFEEVAILPGCSG